MAGVTKTVTTPTLLSLRHSIETGEENFVGKARESCTDPRPSAQTQNGLFSR